MATYEITLVGGEKLRVQGEDLPSAVNAANVDLTQIVSIVPAEAAERATRSPLDDVTIPKATVISLLSHEAAALAFDRLSRDQTRFQVIFGAIITIAGVLGFAVITSPIKNNVLKDLKADQFKDIDDRFSMVGDEFDGLRARIDEQGARIDDRVNRQIEQYQADLKMALDASMDAKRRIELASILGSLQTVAEELDADAVITSDLRNEVTRNVAAVNADKEARLLAQFRKSLEKILRRYASADKWQELAEIDALLGDVLVQSPAISEVMARHYGELLAGGGESPDDWSPNDFKRFQAYMGSLRDSGNYAQQLPLEALIRYIRQGAAPDLMEVKILIRESEERFTAPEQAAFHAQLAVYTEGESWMGVPSAQVRMIEHNMRRFVRDYSDALDAAIDRADVESAMMEIASNLQDDDRQPVIATLRTGGYRGLITIWDADAPREGTTSADVPADGT
jgi:hypothetical protein